MITSAIQRPQFEMSRRIRWVETDASGFVHFACYVRLMEETEYGFLRSRGLSVVLYDERGTMGFPRIHTVVEVERPLTYDQFVKTRLELESIDGKQIVYAFIIHDETNQVAASGRFTVACCRFPDDAPPFAILTPDSVIDALQQTTNSGLND